MKIRLLSLFSGIGAFEKALTNLNIPYELVGYCEIDKYASRAYSLIHNVPESLNLGDIREINENKLPKDIDLITYGFPCQDISIAGQKKGFIDNEGNKTRSGLFYDALRIIKAVNPKVAIAENVKNLLSKSMESVYKTVVINLWDIGYANYVSLLNAKDYGIPQNRERVFIVSIRNDRDNGFLFPEPVPLEKCMRYYLEVDVPSEYDLSQDALKYMDRQVRGGRNHWDFKHYQDTENDTANCITANMYKGVPYNVLVDHDE